MIEIGEHTNVLSLIGAVTYDLANDELYCITELCEMGSLEDLLTSCAKTFTSQTIEGHSSSKYFRTTVNSPALKHRSHYQVKICTNYFIHV